MTLSTTHELIRDILATELFVLSGTHVTVTTVLTVLIVVLVTFWGSYLLRRGLELWFQKRGVVAGGTVHAVSRLLHYVIVFIGFGVSLQLVGISLGALFAAGAVFAIGLGFAMQNIAQNFVSGVILLVERSIKKDDIVRVDGEIVCVHQLGIRSTIVQNRDGLDLIVPNATIVQSTVTNYTLNSADYRIRITVGVSYRSDMALVRKTLDEVAHELAKKWGHVGREHQIAMVDFGSSSVDFQIAVWIDDPWRERVLLSELRCAVWDAFAREGIEIAFPQLDVHFDEGVEAAIAGSLARGGSAGR